MSGPASRAAAWAAGGGPAAVTDGTWRSSALEQTWARLQPLLARRGIARVADLTGLDTLDVPVWTAIRPAAATLVASAGKGIDHLSARVSAVMESLEVAAAEQVRPLVTARGTAAGLRPGYHVAELTRHPLSLADDRTELDWVRGLDLVTGRGALVPAAAVGLRGWAAAEWQPPLFVTTTNGLAGGNDRVEAALHGLLELIERDALARLEPGGAVPVDTDRLGDRLGAVIARIRAAGARVVLERIPSVAGTCACICWLTQPEMWQVFSGSGCHPDAGIAAERALLEAVQSRGSVISGGRDDIPEWTFRRPAAQLSPGDPAPGHQPARPPEPLPPRREAPHDLRETLAGLVIDIHQRTGRPVIAVDLTPPAEPWPAVIQVFAPGLADTQQHPHQAPSRRAA